MIEQVDELDFLKIDFPSITEASVAVITEGKIFRFIDGGNASYLFVPKLQEAE